MDTEEGRHKKGQSYGSLKTDPKQESSNTLKL